MKEYDCPKCGGKLNLVTQSSKSPLNEEQFDSIKAGDYYCDKCEGDRGKKTRHRYYWKRELEIAVVE